jgi:hypothetical protein
MVVPFSADFDRGEVEFRKLILRELPSKADDRIHLYRIQPLENAKLNEINHSKNTACDFQPAGKIGKLQLLRPCRSILSKPPSLTCARFTAHLSWRTPIAETGQRQ